VPRTKVKLFLNIASVSPGIDLQRDFSIEKEINDFLADSNITLIDIKLSSHAAPVGDRVAHYAVSALVVYEQTSS
jgi:hypothetical protein